MALNFCLVAHATQAEPIKLATQCLGNRFADAGFTHTGWPYQQQNGPIDTAFKRADSQKLGDPGLHVVQPVVVRLEGGASFLEVKIVLRVNAPRDRRGPIEVIAGHAVLRGARLQHLELAEFFLEAIAYFLRWMQVV